MFTLEQRGSYVKVTIRLGGITIVQVFKIADITLEDFEKLPRE